MAKKKEKPTFNLSFETKEILDCLSKCKPGDLITFNFLSDLIESNIRSPHKRCHLTSAMRIARRQYGLVFRNRRNIGYVCIAPNEVAVSAGDRTIRKVKSRVRDGNKEIDTIKEESVLSDFEKHKLDSSRTMLGLLEMVASKKTQNAVEKKIISNSEPVKINEIFNLALDRKQKLGFRSN